MKQPGINSVYFLALLVLLMAFPGLVAAQEPTAEPTGEPTVAVTPTTATTEPTAEPTSTSTPTLTLTPTLTPTTTSACADQFEPNNELGSGEVLVSKQALSKLTLDPEGDIDYFQIWVKAGYDYQVDTATSKGVDTRLRLYNELGDLLAENDDYVSGNPASRIRFHAPGDGWLFVSVDSVVPIAWGCNYYSVSYTDYAPATATPTFTPTPTSTPKPAATGGTSQAEATAIPNKADAYEPNYSFDTAANLGVGQMADLNFYVYPPGSAGVDNDFFSIYVKPGQELLIETTDLAGGVDTNIILYRSDKVTVIDGNDDCKAGELRSCLTWSPDYMGTAYLLVGPVGAAPKGVKDESLNYKLSLTDLSGLPDPTVEPGYGEPMPWPAGEPTEEGTVEPEATPAPPELQVKTFSLAPPTPTPLPALPFTLELTVYYDENNNKAVDLNEGVHGINMQVLDSLTNRLLGQAFTDSQGHATIFISSTHNVRVSVPYLGYSQLVKSPGNDYEIRIAPLQLPNYVQ